MKAFRRLPVVSTFLALLVLAARAEAFTTFTVTNTNDSGPGSLRQAILDSNATMDVNTIDFNIPGTGLQTIAALSPLPPITQAVSIHGYSQPGASANTAPPGAALNSVLLIEITGSPIQVNAGNGGVFPQMVVTGLVVPGISCMQGSDGAIVSGNYIGTDASGSTLTPGLLTIADAVGVRVLGGNVVASAVVEAHATGTLIRGNFIGINAAGNAPLGGDFLLSIQVHDSTGVIIGGSTPEDRNVISGAEVVVEEGADQIQILGNYMGTDVTGTKPVNGMGITLQGGHGATIKGNVIAAGRFGITVSAPAPVGAVIQGNFIGTDETASIDLGNGGTEGGGIVVYSDGVLIGGTGPGEGNVIAFNKGGYQSGVYVFASQVTIRGNRLFENAPIGIDLEDSNGFLNFITVNDINDLDDGSNGLQNFPIITSVVPGASTTHIEGKLNSKASLAYGIDLFSNPACLPKPRAHLEGETYLTSLSVMTDGFGNATFAVDVPVVLSAGQLVTATATDPDGNTSEISQRLVFTVEPLSGPAGQPTDVTVKGMEFEIGATVTVGGVPATNVAATSKTTITATMPAFPAGTLHDLTVAVPSGLSSTLPNGWLTDYSDMPPSNPFHDSVVHLVSNGVAAGVGNGNYGGANPTLREQMAVFLLKGRHGACYTPPPCSGVFADVACPSLFAPWIEALAAEGITAGCGGDHYCPTDPVLREQMAVFLLKAQHGASYVPPPCQPFFTDFPCPSQYADWIYQLATEQVTAGCGDHIYCPGDAVLREQMAVFVTKTFSLP